MLEREYFSDIFRYSNIKSVGGTMHSHHYHDNRFEIYYMVSGKCSYFVNDKCYDVGAGDIVLIPEGIIHKTNYNGQEHNRILIECESSFVPDDIRMGLSEIGYLYRNETASREILDVLGRIESEYKSSDEYTIGALRAYVRILLTVLLRHKNAVGDDVCKNGMVESVVAYVKENFHTDVTLSDTAKRFFVSAEHLSRTFKRHTGFGFNEFLTLIRLQHAENLLKSRDGKSISEIAYSCGFNDSNYFSDKFHRVYGISPLKYSKEYKRK